MTERGRTAVDDPTAIDTKSYPYRPALDGLRALAVLGVIAFHNGYAWAVGGFLGVDAFFVLSGFLITTLLVREYQRRAGIHLGAFWARRLRRLLPALLLVLLFCALYAGTRLHPFELTQFRWDAFSSLFYVTNWRFIASGQSYFDLFSTPSPVRHLWSLAIEEQFYLLWPLVVVGCLRLRRGRPDLLAVVCVIGAAASAVAMAVLYEPGSPSRAYYGTDTRVHTLLIGALLALALNARPRLAGRGARVLQLAGGLALVAIFWCWHVVVDTDRGYYGWGSVLFAVGVAIVIAAASHTTGWFTRILGAAPLRNIGVISYGLYLWHWPIIVWLTAERVGFGDSRLVALRLALTFAAACLSYRFVEQPIRHGRWLRSRPRTRRWIVVLTVVATGTAIVVGSAGAQSPPSYMVGLLEPCPAPSAAEIHGAGEYFREHGAPSTVGSPPAIAMVGDSVACSLEPGLQSLRRDSRWRFGGGSIIGCGQVSGEVLASDAVPVIAARTDTCPILARDLRDTALRFRAPVVLWISSWERADLAVAGRRVASGSAEWFRVLTARITEVVRATHASGARLVLATMPSHAPGQLGIYASKPSRADATAFGHLNLWLLRIAAAHPDDVRLIDLAGFVCPSGPPCPRTVDGIAPRAIDGLHFTPAGSAWVLDWLLPKVAAVAATEHRPA